MSCLFDDPAVSAQSFYPHRDSRPAPPHAQDLRIEVQPGIRLRVRLHESANASAALLVFPGNAESAADYDPLAQRFLQLGLTLAVLDYRGFGQSDGQPTLRTCITDVHPVLEGLLPRLSSHGLPLPVIVMGRSLGAMSAAELCQRLPRFAAGFILESGCANLLRLAHKKGFNTSAPLSREDYDLFEPTHKLRDCHTPLLLLHGAKDTVLEPQESQDFFEASGADDKHLVLLPTRGHNDLMLDPLYWEELAFFVHRVVRRADRRAGAMIGQALGDAIGFLVEGESAVVCGEFVKRAFAKDLPPQLAKGHFAFGQYSDDTQLARELGLSLTHQPGWNPPDYARRIAELFASHRVVGRGRATEAAAMRLFAGVPWDEAGQPAPQAGNGAAMRAAPIGLRFGEEQTRLKVADEQARITHRDLRARSAALLVADVVGEGIHRKVSARAGSGPWLEWLSWRVQPSDKTLSKALLQMPAWLRLSPEQAAMQIAKVGEDRAQSRPWPGISPFATPSVLYALYAYMRSPDSIEQTLKTAISVGGDVDTVGAMAGAMVGSSVGYSGLEVRLQAWAKELNDQGSFGLTELMHLAHALA